MNCSELQWTAVNYSELQWTAVNYNKLQGLWSTSKKHDCSSHNTFTIQVLRWRYVVLSWGGTYSPLDYEKSRVVPGAAKILTKESELLCLYVYILILLQNVAPVANVKCFVCNSATIVTFRPCSHSVLCNDCSKCVKKWASEQCGSCVMSLRLCMLLNLATIFFVQVYSNFTTHLSNFYMYMYM